MELVLVKASAPGQQDRTYLRGGESSVRLAVHVVHDLPHLAVESLFEIRDGLWSELADGRHRASNRAVTARQPRRQKLGRIVSGAASGDETDAWLSQGHRLAKTATNCVTNRWGDGPDTPAGVRQRLSQAAGKDAQALLDRLDDETIGLAIRGVRELNRLWAETPPGGMLRLSWPLPRSFFETAGGPPE